MGPCWRSVLLGTVFEVSKHSIPFVLCLLLADQTKYELSATALAPCWSAWYHVPHNDGHGLTF